MDNSIVQIVVSILAVVVVGYLGSPLFIWAIAILGLLFWFGASIPTMGVVAGLFLLFIIKPIRTLIVSKPLMGLMKGFMPKISETERTALEAGVVWVEQDLFSGKPDFKKMLNEPYPGLTVEEKAFMEGPCEKLCSMIDAWAYWKTREMEDQVWDFIKKEGFLGMIIPKEYGGLGFSALAHSEVVMKVASRSIPACVTVMVPNSLGPAELLIHYGTDEQKKHYLPRLARGIEVPCFGLTEPGAGSDAGAIVSSGELFKGDDGKLYIKLNWNKRYITLAAISTVIGLAFKLKDPKNLLGKGEDLGITAALIPASTPGVVIGKRHDPLGVPFYNCPTQGKDVVVSIDAVVGGAAGCGKGWLMLMECLAAGRGISLPAQSVGGAKLCTRVTSAHSVVRQQFGVSIGLFEGIEEPLARIAGLTYGLEAMRIYTLGALDKGIKPPVITAMSKYYSTEIGRQMINDAMDIVGGAGISFGPRNLIGQIYVATPIGITVEGANILTRTLIIFGQGALRAHPYAFKEVDSVEKGDAAGFDSAFWGHVGHVVRNTFRSVVLSMTRGYLAPAPVHPELKMYVRRLTWASASYAIMSDVAMGTLGGTLKFREKVTGRFADILAWMYIATATLRRFEAEGRREEDLAFAKYVLKKSLSEIQKAFDGIFDNMYAVKQKSITGKLIFGSMHFFFKEVIGAWSRINSIGSQASDHLQHVICYQILNNLEQRERLTDGIYVPKDPSKEQLARLENAMKLSLEAEKIEKKISKARREKILPKLKGQALVEAAFEKKVIAADEYQLLKRAAEARWDAIQVDDFTQEQYVSNHV
ncbi:MAG: acyl-CoA dehydrogenase [Oligoflexia bacterium]|nr:MAG: acyl-CoA dehydrogenase [Oligoflexia bacterium]